LTNSPTPSSRAPARRTWPTSPRPRSSSSTISGCGSCRRPPRRICWRSSCGGMNGRRR
jgi:hypothetical protein